MLNIWDRDLHREVEVRAVDLELAVCVKGNPGRVTNVIKEWSGVTGPNGESE